MEWNGIEWGGTDNLPHFFLLILGASESYFWALEFNSRVASSILRSSGLSDETANRGPVSVCPLYFGRTLNPRSLTDSSDLSDGTFTRKNLLP